jgi:LysR family hydrogen peroxide-inducible transcriptional activator
VFGGDLFVRGRGNRLALTPIGSSVEPYAVDVLATVDTQMRRAMETAQSRAGQLAVGFYPSIASGPLREGLRSFCAESPEVHLQMVEGLPGDLHRQLHESKIDVMVAAFIPRQTAPVIERSPLWEERLFVALPLTHRSHPGLRSPVRRSDRGYHRSCRRPSRRCSTCPDAPPGRRTSVSGHCRQARHSPFR